VRVVPNLPLRLRRVPSPRFPLNSRLSTGPARRSGGARVAPRTPRLPRSTLLPFRRHVVANAKPSEQYRKKEILKCHLLPAFGRLRLSEIRTQQAEEYKRAKLEAGYAPKSVKNQVSVLTTVLRAAVDWGELDAMPTIRTIKVSPPAFRFLTNDEEAKLIGAAENPRAEAMLRVVADTGMRIGELLALTWADVDFARDQIRIWRSQWRGKITTTKNNGTRYVGLSRNARVALQAVHHQNSEFVFCRADGRPGSEGTAYDMIRRTYRRAGVDASGWHVLRHTFATNLVTRGIPLYHVQALLGHSTPMMTQRYAHLAPDTLRDAIRVLDVPPVVPSYPSFGQPVGKQVAELAEMFRKEAA